MAGQPKRRAMIAELERRTREELGDDATHLDYAVHWQESGRTLIDLAKSVAAVTMQPMLVATLSKYLRESEPGGDTRLTHARARGAHVLVEEALEKADEATEDNVQVSKLQADTRIKIAERWNREELGVQRQGVSVTLNIGTAHIGAMRVREIEPSVIVPVIAAPAEDATFEIIDT